MPMPSKKPPLDPLIIQSFPSPPTHIPSTINPPPSRPPSLPLPLLPPTPNHDTLLSYSYSRPPSVLEEQHPSLTRISISPMPALSDNDYDDQVVNTPNHHRHQANESISSIDMRDLMLDDDENVYAEGVAPPQDLDIAKLNRPRDMPAHRPHLPSIADPIDPQTLHLHIRIARSTSENHRQLLRSRSSASRPRSPVSSPPSQPLPPLPGTPSTPTKQGDKGIIAFPTSNNTQPPSSPPLPIRSSSPDIDTIISTTPRPSRRPKSQSRPRSSASLPASQSLSNSTSSTTGGMKRRASEGVIHPTPRKTTVRRSDALSSYSEGAGSQLPYVRGSAYLDADDDDARSWIEPDEFARRPSILPKASRMDDEERERERRLERALEGEGSDSDSSLDIHTPLPLSYFLSCDSFILC